MYHRIWIIHSKDLDWTAQTYRLFLARTRKYMFTWCFIKTRKQHTIIIVTVRNYVRNTRYQKQIKVHTQIATEPTDHNGGWKNYRLIRFSGSAALTKKAIHMHFYLRPIKKKMPTSWKSALYKGYQLLPSRTKSYQFGCCNPLWECQFLLWWFLGYHFCFLLFF